MRERIFGEPSGATQASLREIGLFRMTRSRLFRHATPRNVVVAVLAIEAVVVGLIFAQERALRRANEAQMRFNLNPDVLWRENQAKAIVRPATISAKEAKIRPEEVVLGIEVGGNARAYRLDALHDEGGHLVNDLIGGVPVSVSYCNLTDCARVYTDPQGSAPLDVEIAGVYNLEMVVKIGGNLYFQNSGVPVEPGKSPSAIPYHVLTPKRTTWADWSRHHPETDVYIGARREFPKGRPATTTGLQGFEAGVSMSGSAMG